MNYIDIIQSVILGIVEGITEFLPISSTGHLIIAKDALGLTYMNKIDLLIVMIQSGAILAVVWIYYKTILDLLIGLIKGKKSAWKLATNLTIAFTPSALFAFAFGEMIKQALFTTSLVAVTLILGGVMILFIENWHRDLQKEHPLEKEKYTGFWTTSLQELSYQKAFALGCIQIFSLIPGVSRSGSTIMGGLCLKMTRQVATEFSFLVGLMTLCAATLYSGYKEINFLKEASVHFMDFFFISWITAFISAFISVKFLLKYITYRDFKPFGWYRIIVGIVLLYFI